MIASGRTSAAAPHDPATASGPDAEIGAFLVRTGLVASAEQAHFAPMSGGVASDIWLVEAGGRRFCVKRALPKLRVAAEWFVPVERNANEAAWLRFAAGVAPGAAPRVLAEEAGLFAMEYLPPEHYPNWKAQLLAGAADAATAQSVGAALGRIHAAAAARPDLAARFRSDDIFMAIRLDPYLLATAKAHPDLRAELERLVTRTMVCKQTLVHGDVSPKNILVGAAGPVFLDAECAWWGDPAFDLAFCLNHLLLKCLCHPPRTADYLRAFEVLAAAYLDAVTWEDSEGLEARTAALLPGLLLARVDGKSPVEYLRAHAQRELVRGAACAMLAEAPRRLADVARRWAGDMQRVQ